MKRKRSTHNDDASTADASTATPVASGFEQKLHFPPKLHHFMTEYIFAKPLYRSIIPSLDRKSFFYTSEHAIYQLLQTGNIKLLAGESNTSGFEDKTGPAARFNNPLGLELSMDGKTLFVADSLNDRIRRVNIKTGAVTTIAGGNQGQQDGVGLAAGFFFPRALTSNSDGTILFVGDAGNSKIRRIHIPTKAVTTILSRYDEDDFDPADIALTSDGATLIVADCKHHKIRRVDVASGAMTILAGSVKGDSNGNGKSALFDTPFCVALGEDDKHVYVGDTRRKITCINIKDAEVTTFAGSGKRECRDGIGRDASFFEVYGLTTFRTVHGGFKLLVLSDRYLRSSWIDTVVKLGTIEVPPSTLSKDILQTMGNASMPDGKITFIVGHRRRRFAHLNKAILCVRSEYFQRMFTGPMRESSESEIRVPDANPDTFDALLRYLLADVFDTEADSHYYFRLLALARKYLVHRLKDLCLHQLEMSVEATTVIPLLEAAQRMGEERVFQICRTFVANNSGAVSECGGVEKLVDFGVTKGLLKDALAQLHEATSTSKRIQEALTSRAAAATKDTS